MTARLYRYFLISKIRVALGLRIHDAELAELFMTEPFLRHSNFKLPRIANSDLWTAPTANEWARILKEQGQQPLSTFSPFGLSLVDVSKQQRSIPGVLHTTTDPLTVYVLLEGTATSIFENRCANSLDQVFKKIENTLFQIYDDHLQHQTEQSPFCLRALWHSVLISLYCDMNKIECAVGREGYDEAQAYCGYATAWAISAAGHRCAIHAALVLSQLENMLIGAEPAIHVPRLLYRAALIWYTYTRFGYDDQCAPSHPELDFPELVKLGIKGRELLFEANGFKLSRPSTSQSSTLFRLIDLLKRSGHWGISRKMASLLSLLIHGRSDSDRTGIP